MKNLKLLLILLMLVSGFSSCVSRPAKTNVVVVKRQRPAKVVVVRPARHRRVVVVRR